MAQKTHTGAGPNPPSRSGKSLPSIEATPVDGSNGGGRLTREQRNQAAFIHAVTGRCGCKDIDNCADCRARDWSGQMLASDSGVARPEY